MPVVHRLVRARYASDTELLAGQGAALAPGRWNERGTPLVYASAHLSLAVLEILASTPTLPRDMLAVEITLPAKSSPRWTVPSLLPDWTEYPAPPSTQQLGNRWASAAKALAVWVPSVVVPTEWNCLLNPAHPDIRGVRARVVGPFRFDGRLERPRP